MGHLFPVLKEKACFSPEMLNEGKERMGNAVDERRHFAQEERGETSLPRTSLRKRINRKDEQLSPILHVVERKGLAQERYFLSSGGKKKKKNFKKTRWGEGGRKESREVQRIRPPVFVYPGSRDIRTAGSEQQNTNKERGFEIVSTKKKIGTEPPENGLLTKAGK